VPEARVHPPASDLPDRSRQRRSRPFSWESRHSWLDLAAGSQTSLSLLLHPSHAFNAVNYQEGIRSSLVYALVYGSLGQIIGQYWLTLARIHSGHLDAGALGNTARFAGAALVTPAAVLVTLCLAACLVHLMLRVLGAVRRSFSATFQVIAYTSGATSLLQAVPFLGNLLMPFWAVVVSCIGLAAAHQTSRVKVLMALLLPLFLSGLLITAGLLALAAFGVLHLLESIPQPL
jgi:hypothetical protein